MERDWVTTRGNQSIKASYRNRGLYVFTFGYSRKNSDSATLINNLVKDIHVSQLPWSSDSGSNAPSSLNSLKAEDVVPSTVHHNTSSSYIWNIYSVGKQFNTLFLEHHHNPRRWGLSISLHFRDQGKEAQTGNLIKAAESWLKPKSVIAPGLWFTISYC